MSRKIPNPSIARYAAVVAAALWAVLGLANAYATGLGRGVDAFVIVAIVVNVALIIAAALTFVNASYWRIALIVALTIVTLDRILNVIGTGANGLTVVSSVFVLVALITISLMARQR
ncbi:MAG: hypothetical protein M3Z37_06735 [Candidatus Eremiobacteraeota bacterium]|nr:hypothetical protein [Candidatus Eremiobacteraeota bacterium]